MVKPLSFIASLACISPALLVSAQDGAASAGTPSHASGYSCDPSTCKLPTCNCASTSPPGGLKPSEVPQFIVFTADDAVQTYTIDSVNQFLAKRKNPNSCQPKMTYYTSLNYTDYSLVTDWYVAGNEIADHTMTHPDMAKVSSAKAELTGNLVALNTLAGIPMSSLKGFRAPFLSYTVDTLKMLKTAGFTYDSSASASIPVTDPASDAYWPYTLDNGLANDCSNVPGACHGEPKIPGLWEIPMYAFFDKRGVAGVHLMDPWLDPANGAAKVDDAATLEYMKSTFTDHYNGNRQPIGLYTHPVHLAYNHPSIPPLTSTIKMLNDFLDWATNQPNVWIISSEQLLDWVQNPTSIANIDSLASLKCAKPNVDSATKVCNGIPGNEAGLLGKCAFADTPFSSCYGCPEVIPSPENPNPKQASGAQARFRLPQNCSTPFWDPIAGKCLCTGDACAFTDESRDVGSDGSSGAGISTSGSASPTGTTGSTPGSGGSGNGALGKGGLSAVVLGLVGAMLGASFVL